jgi:hypothetical protein
VPRPDRIGHPHPCPYRTVRHIGETRQNCQTSANDPTESQSLRSRPDRTELSAGQPDRTENFSQIPDRFAFNPFIYLILNIKLVKVMRMSRPELLCGIAVHSFRLHLLVSLNSLHGICFARRSQPNNAKGSQLVKVMCMSRPELLCGIAVHYFRLHLRR